MSIDTRLDLLTRSRDMLEKLKDVILILDVHQDEVDTCCDLIDELNREVSE